MRPANCLLAFFLCLFFEKNFAQSPVFGCGEAEIRASIFSKNGEQQRRHEAFEQQLYKFFEEKIGQQAAEKGAAAAPLVLPIVVHIVHNGGAENISDAQILTAIDNLNDAFAAAGYFQFQGATENTEIKFCLATLDPDGQPTTGITRNQSPLTNVTSPNDDLDLKNLNRWNPLDYINIWVVAEITSASAGAGVAGYAYLPFSHGQPEDGIVCEARFFGVSPADDGVFIHEMGHYLGLYHTFEGGCPNANCLLDGDRICDTPPDQATHTGCIFNSCSTDVAMGSPFSSDVNDLTENFMDYSPLACYRSFTAGQAARMRATVETTRASLLDSKACGQPCLQPLNAQFSLAGSQFFAGQTVVFQNQSSGATNFSWQVNGLFFSNLENPNFTFPMTGSFTISLVATNSDLNCEDKFSQIFKVVCPIVADFTASATSAKIGETINFVSTSTGGATDFRWFINGVLLGSGANFDYTFSAAGDFTVVLRASNGFCESEQIIFVKVKTDCEPTVGAAKFLYNIGGGKEFYPYCATATPDGGLLTYGQITQNGYTGVIQKTDAAGEIIWANRLENVESVYKMVVSPTDNTYILVGQNKVSKSIFLMKVAAATGATVWKNDFNNLIYKQLAYDLAMLPGGDVVVLMNDGLLARFTAAGNPVWSKRVDADIVAFFTSIVRRPDGVILLTGFNPKEGFNKTSVHFLDENGLVLDTKFYGVAGSQSVVFNDVVANSDNSFVISGSFRAFGSAYTEQRGVVFKCNAAGDVLWSKKLDFEAAPTHSAIKNYVVKTSDGGYILYGASTVTWTNRLFMKIDGAGKMLWGRELQVPSLNMNLVNLAENGTAGCWIAQNGSNRLHLAKVDGNGSAGGCDEISHTILTENLPLSILTKPQVATDFPLQIAAGVVNFTAVNFQKQTLCSQPAPCPEVCDNGFDDDEDGYVDCFDPDCDCSVGDDCTTPAPPSNAIAAKLAWESQTDSLVFYATPIVANLDPQRDALPEIILPYGKRSIAVDCQRIAVLKGDGSNRNAPRFFDLPEKTFAFTSIAVGDLDGDKIPEVVVVAGVSGRIHIFKNYDPTEYQAMELWLSSDVGSTSTIVSPTPALADFDGDGRPEIYAGDAVFQLDLSNAAAPKLLRRLKGGQAYGANISPSYDATSVAADLLSPTDCNGDPDCAGLELAAGYSIYSIDLDPTDGDGIEIKVQRDLRNLTPNTNWTDGMTTVADINLDGTPEVVFSTKRNSTEHGICAWNKDGLLQFFSMKFVFVSYSGSLPCIANVFDDRTAGAATDLPEIIVSANNQIFAFNFNAAAKDPNLPIWWRLTTVDGSGCTGASAFDFNGDGRLEILHRDEARLRILYGGSAPFPTGVNANREWFSTQVVAGTAFESPTVADVDNDGVAEIIIGGGADKSHGTGKIKIFEHATPAAWQPARPLWNQFHYHFTNVNDDLTIPAVPQKHWLEFPASSGRHDLNQVLTQKSSLKNPGGAIPVPDASAVFQKIECKNDSLELQIEVCNAGSAVLPAATPVQFYLKNPTAAAAQLFAAAATPQILKIDSCLKMKITLPRPPSGSQIFGIVNDDGSLPAPFDLKNDFPSTAQPECDFENNIFNFNFSIATPTLNLGSDLEICQNSVVKIAAPAGFKKYRWHDGSGDSTFTATPPGKFWLDVWDGCGQKLTDTVEIKIAPQLNFDLGANPKICPGDSVLLTAAAPPATIFWTKNLTEKLCDDCPAVWVKPTQTTVFQATAKIGGCFFSDSVRVEVAPDFQISSFQTDPKCAGDSTGTIDLQAAAGAPPLNFAWSIGGVGNVSKLENLPAGNFSATVSDATGCSKTFDFQLLAPPDWQISSFQTDPKCAGDSTGTIDLQAAAGSPPLDFSWSLAGVGNVSKLENLPAGNFSATVSDAAGCSKTFDFQLLAPPDWQILTFQTDPKCAGDSTGTIDLQAAAGAPPLDFSWSLAGVGNVSKLENLPAGNFSATISDAVGCSKTFDFQLLAPPDWQILTAKTDPKCAGDSTGTIDLQAAAGAPPLDFSWSLAGVGNVSKLENLPAGNFSATVSDAVGCSKTFDFQLLAPPDWQISSFQTDPKCAGDSTGTIDLQAAAGAPPLDFLWSLAGAGNVSKLENLPAGNFSATVSDAAGCSKTFDFQLLAPADWQILTAKTDPKCAGENSGSIDLQAAAGSPSLDFSWSLAGAGNVSKLENLPAGNFSATVSDAVGCSKTFDFQLLAPPDWQILTSKTDPKCAGENSGSIDLQAAAGSPPLDFSWSLAGAGNVSKLENLPAGNFSATVSDAVGCSKTFDFQLVASPDWQILTAKTDPKCAGDSTGTIDLQAAAGAPPLDFSWSLAGAGNVSKLENLPAGNFSATVSDAVGCSKTFDFQLVAPPDWQILTAKTDPKCAGDSTGTIDLQAAAGAPPLDFSWSLAGAGNVSKLENLPAGNFSATVSDAAGCSKTFDFQLVASPDWQILTAKTDPKCAGDSTGTIDLQAAAGAPPLNFSWSLAGVGNVSKLENLPAGNFSATISDATGCSKIIDFELVEPPVLTVELTVSDSLVAAGEVIVLTSVANASASFPMVLDWQPSQFFDANHEFSEEVLPTENTVFSIKIGDANGCTATASQEVRLEQPVIFVPNVFSPGSAENGKFTVFGGSAVRSVRWLRVYDRWGELIFERLSFAANLPDLGWDGWFRGRRVGAGVYVFWVSVEFLDGSVHEIVGDLSVF